VIEEKEAETNREVVEEVRVSPSEDTGATHHLEREGGGDRGGGEEEHRW